ncbi:MAG: hypothetical protein IPK53_11070 [bacterium]|nr:hypothetical protein [bacterium]
MYIESRFALRHEKLRQERQALLNQDTRLYREPHIEFVPPYQSSGKKLSEAAAEIDGLPPELGDFAAHGLFDPGYSLHQHQYEAIKAAQDKHVVITVGTGSGKTESFLIPSSPVCWRSPASGLITHLALGHGGGAVVPVYLSAVTNRLNVRRPSRAHFVPNERPGGRPDAAPTQSAR